MSAISEWGSTPGERLVPNACDRLLPKPEDTCYRAIELKASPEIVFRWLCQLRVARYSVDWIDNLGVGAPAEAQPGSGRSDLRQALEAVGCRP